MLATLVLTNGHFYTMDASQPRVSAVAVRDGVIVATGNDDEMRALLAPGGEWLDLGGRTVIPGLVDAHVHFQWFSLNLQRVDLYEVPSKEEGLRRIAATAGTLAPGQWLEGRGWTQEVWADRAFPTAADLDAVAGHVPAYLAHKSGHAAWVNSRALKLAGITADTPDPAGGQIARDDHGEPTGLLLESAMDLVARLIPPPTPSARRRGDAGGTAGLLAGRSDGAARFRRAHQLRGAADAQEAGGAGAARGEKHPCLPAGTRDRHRPA